MPQRTIVITGASDGIGAAAARQLAPQGDRLLLVGRSPEKTAAVAREVKAEHFIADFSKLDDVRALAPAIQATTDRVDVLANNAGGIFGQRSLTGDGHEKTFQVNYLAPFLLTNLLLPQLQASEGIVVNTSSSAAKLLAKFDIDDIETEKSFTPNAAYGNAKLGNILFSQALQSHYGNDGISSVAFDPGNVRTNFASDTTSIMRIIYRTPLSRLILTTPEKGGSNLAFFANGTPRTTWLPGRFYTQTVLATEKNTNPLVHDTQVIDQFWDKSANLLGIPTK